MGKPTRIADFFRPAGRAPLICNYALSYFKLLLYPFFFIFFACCGLRESGSWRSSGAITLYCVISPYQTETHTHTTNSAPHNHHQARRVTWYPIQTNRNKTGLERQKRSAHTQAHTPRRESHKTSTMRSCSHGRHTKEPPCPPRIRHRARLAHLQAAREAVHADFRRDESEPTRSSREEGGLRQTPAPGPWASS